MGGDGGRREGMGGGRGRGKGGGAEKGRGGKGPRELSGWRTLSPSPRFCRRKTLPSPVQLWQRRRWHGAHELPVQSRCRCTETPSGTADGGCAACDCGTCVATSANLAWAENACTRAHVRARARACMRAGTIARAGNERVQIGSRRRGAHMRVLAGACEGKRERGCAVTFGACRCSAPCCLSRASAAEAASSAFWNGADDRVTAHARKQMDPTLARTNALVHSRRPRAAGKRSHRTHGHTSCAGTRALRLRQRRTGRHASPCSCDPPAERRHAHTHAHARSRTRSLALAGTRTRTRTRTRARAGKEREAGVGIRAARLHKGAVGRGRAHPPLEVRHAQRRRRRRHAAEDVRSAGRPQRRRRR
jgi:hypothetical protein